MDFIKVSDQFEYSTVCLESFPCQHYVKLNDEEQLWNGKKICHYMEEHNLDIPEHFKIYYSRKVKPMNND